MNNQAQGKAGYKRRNYMINPGFQLRFMFYVAFMILVGLFVIYLSNLWYFDTIVDQGKEIGLDESHPYYEFIEQQRSRLDKTYAVVSVVVFVALMAFGLLLSHHIAGPLYRIKVYMKCVAGGASNLPPVKLRDGDFFTDVADSLNNMLAAIHAREPGITAGNHESRQSSEERGRVVLFDENGGKITGKTGS